MASKEPSKLMFDLKKLLIQDLTSYIEKYEKSWIFGRSHYERAVSVLTALKTISSDNEFCSLIKQQMGLLNGSEATIVWGKSEDKHNHKPKNRLSGDGFTLAIENCFKEIVKTDQIKLPTYSCFDGNSLFRYRETNSVNKEFSNFDEAFFAMKNIFENHLSSSLPSKTSRTLIVHTLVVSRLVPELLNQSTETKYYLNFGKYANHHSEVHHANNYEKIFHQEFDEIKLSVLQRAKPHNPSKLDPVKAQYLNLINKHYAQEFPLGFQCTGGLNFT